jgi:outer membrane receptor protein involved in Fe transport
VTLSIRILAAVLIAALSVGPVSAAAVQGAATTVAQATTTGVLQGTAIDESGAPVVDAHVTLRGPNTTQTTTDATGSFSFDSVQPGLYVITVQKPGFDTASESDLAIFAGETSKLAVTMHTATLTSLRTIATVRSVGGGTFNVSPASVNIISVQAFNNQGQAQVGRVLNQIPGVQNTLPTSSANGSVQGAITVPNIRGGLSFETASLIDGHPLAVGDFGDYVTTFLNSNMLGSVEVIKGPGATSPETNYAIGGTVNFRTKDPTLTPTPYYDVGLYSKGGTFSNFGFADTVGRLGFVFDYATIDETAPLNGYSSYFQLYGNNAVQGYAGGSSGINVSENSPYNNAYVSNTFVPGTSTRENNGYSLLACCYTYQGYYDSYSELAKLHYKLSSATTATVSYLGSQSYADQNANTSELIPSTFAPPAGLGYTGSLAPGSAVNIPNGVYPTLASEINNEPIFQAEMSTTVGNDTILARYYHASIDRLIYEGNANPAVPVTGQYQLYGVNPAAASSCHLTTCPPVTYNGQTVPVSFFDWYNQYEQDRLSGLSFQYSHPFGDGNDITFSADQTHASSTAGSVGAPFTNVVSGTNTYKAASSPVGTPSVSNPGGTNQVFTTFLLRTVYHLTPKLTGTLALYDNQYQNTFPQACLNGSGAIGASCTINGSNAVFTTNHNTHFDQRLALEYRASRDLALRFSAGSAIAPPYLSLLSKPQTAISCSASTCTFSANNPALVPETAFGYDFGADYRFRDGFTFLSGDAYLTDLYNHFLAEQISIGTCGTVTGCPGAAGLPVYQSFNTNLANSRFEGIELSLRRIVPAGFGFDFAGAVQHAYAYNLPPGFYCQNLPLTGAGAGCTPNHYNVNLPIIAGQNFTGNTFGTVSNCGAGGNPACTSATPGSTVGASGLSNTAIPYFQGNADVNFTTRNGIYALFGETFYGKNNGYNIAPFGIAYATLRLPVNNTLSFQISGDNIFNADNALFPTVGSGIPYPLANGTYGANIANTVGPATFRFEITKKI